jgi:predicted acylesterase/phospholipase RssA
MTEHCDLVMKGGITSGVVYPKLIARLASKYQFKNIGGTSAGAIAAGACAAAQYGRHHGNPQAFEALADLPDVLSEKAAADGKSKLFRLFQPAVEAREHFSVLAGALNHKPAQAALAIIKGMAGMYWKLLGAGLLLGSLLLYPFISALRFDIGCGATLTAALISMLMVAGFAALCIAGLVKGLKRSTLWLFGLWALMALMLALIGGQFAWQLFGTVVGMTIVALLAQGLLLLAVVGLFARGLFKALHGNNYGLCSGKTPEDSAGEHQQGLTDWLTAYFNTLAGLPVGSRPLTFGDLWGTNPGQREINLEMMTTAVSQQMVYGIPFRADAPTFYYDPAEWAKLFPQSVMTFLDQLQASADAAASPTAEQRLPVHGPTGKILRRFSAQADLPVVVAVRMSLSFPLLLSAIPLYAIDWTLKESADSKKNHQPIVAKRIWFSDGGIGSNMPLHLFDSLLPDHPTFAINLKAQHDDYDLKDQETKENRDGRIYLPTDNRGGRQRFWSKPDDSSPLAGLVGFFASIVGTMHSWRDELMFPYPGFRDRIVQISLRPDEGGLNLDMPEESIEKLGNAGAFAAERLIDSFHPEGEQAGKGWQAHRKTRLETFLAVTQPAFIALDRSLTNDNWGAYLDDCTAQERKAATDFLAGVQQLGQTGQQAGNISFEKLALKPLAQMKITPVI